MANKIRVAVLDDHPSVIDGYHFRLINEPDIEIVAYGYYGEYLEPMLKEHKVDVLILDINLPTSRENRNPYPILHLIPHILETHPGLIILIISMYAHKTMVKSVMDSGASGYIVKDDAASFQNLAGVVRTVARGGIHLSPEAYEQLVNKNTDELSEILSSRQLQALSLCAAYPDASTAELAKKMGIESSTMRNLLSGAYVKLHVSTRAAAIAKAKQIGLISGTD